MIGRSDLTDTGSSTGSAPGRSGESCPDASAHGRPCTSGTYRGRPMAPGRVSSSTSRPRPTPRVTSIGTSTSTPPLSAPTCTPPGHPGRHRPHHRVPQKRGLREDQFAELMRASPQLLVSCTVTAHLPDASCVVKVRLLHWSGSPGRGGVLQRDGWRGRGHEVALAGHLRDLMRPGPSFCTTEAWTSESCPTRLVPVLESPIRQSGCPFLMQSQLVTRRQIPNSGFLDRDRDEMSFSVGRSGWAGEACDVSAEPLGVRCGRQASCEAAGSRGIFVLVMGDRAGHGR